jgi:hypothetical protein
MAVEYVLVVVLVGLGVLFAMIRFGSAVRGRTETAESHVAALDASDRTAAEDGSVGSVSASADSGAAPSDPSNKEAPSASAPSGVGRPGDGKVDVLGFRITMSTAIWLGILIVVVGALTIMRMTRGVKAASKHGDEQLALVDRLTKGGGESGQAMLEFFLAMLVGVMMILGVVQIGLMFNAKSMVKLAAFNAARAAIVARDPSSPTGAVDIEEMKKKAKIAAFATILPVIPALHGKLPTSFSVDSLQSFAGSSPTVPGLAASAIAYELNGPTIDDDFNQIPCFTVDFVDPTAADPTAPSARITSWPSVEFDDPANADANVVKVLVTWQYPLVIPFVNRIFTAMARPRLYGLALFRAGSGNFLQQNDIQPWAYGFTLDTLSTLDIPGIGSIPSNLAGVVQSLVQYVVYRVPIRETYVMRMQWDRRP